MNFQGHSGDDNFTGTNHADTFELSDGGHDTADGGKGDDIFLLGDTFGSGDALTGGEGNDTVTERPRVGRLPRD